MAEDHFQPKAMNPSALRGSMVHEFIRVWHETKDTELGLVAASKLLQDHLEENEPFYTPDEVEKIVKIECLVKGMCRALPKWLKKRKGKIVASEYTLKAGIPGADSSRHFGFYQGTADAILQTPDGFWIVDYKTRSGLHSRVHDWLHIDAQTIGYNWLLRRELQEKRFLVQSRKPVIGVIWVAMLVTKIRHKQKQTVEEYWAELEEVYAQDPDKYFRSISVAQTENQIQEFEKDLVDDALMIQDPSTPRPRNTANCLSFGRTCSYLPICVEGWTRVNKQRFHKKVPNYWEPKVDLGTEIDE